MTPIEKLRAATSYLIIHHPFVAVPLLRLRLQADSTEATAATDGRSIYYNPDFVADLSYEETIFLLAHEVLHVALAHHLRRADRYPKAWNAAADYVINLMLEGVGFTLIAGALHDLRYAGWSTEKVYRFIVQQAEEDLAAATSVVTTGSRGDTKEPALDDFIPEGTGGRVIDMKGEDGSELSQAERTQEESNLSVTLNQALRAEAMVRSDQSLATAFARVVQPIAPGFNARAELAEFITTTIGRDDYTWTRPNSRYLPAGLYLPSLSSSLTLLDVIVAIDTSGSISPRLLSFMAGACDELLLAFPQAHLRVVYCDSAVRSTEDLTVDDCPVTLRNAQGGGGTRFSPVFEWVAENGLQPAFLLYMTDLYGDSPEDPGYPVLWLTIKPVSRPHPFGRRIDLSVLD